MRRWWLVLFLAFTVVPTVELYVLLQLGQWMGPLATVLLILSTGTLGAWVARREGASVLQQLRRDLDRGLPPASRLVEGALVLAGGLLLVTPGVFTDLAGFSFLLPPTRRLLAPLLLRWFKGRFTGAVTDGGFSASFGSGEPPEAPWEREPDPEPVPFSKGPFDHPVR